ncbi:MAG: MATE family efflux transporter, partial [Bacteroides sp.]|nr:MATE family efflux transporter [Bacteroides sp.]
HFYSQKSFVRFRKSCFRLRLPIIRNIFGIGMSPFVMNVCACCIVIFINNRLSHYGGDLSIGAFGILNRIQMLFVMIVMGITMGMQPISGYNYGAKNFERVKRTLKLGIIAGTIITTTGFIACELFPKVFVGMFTDNAELTQRASIALQIGVASFPVIGAQIVITQFFQSIGKAAVSIFLSLSRQLLYLLPGLAFLPPFFGVNGVWSSMPVSDMLAFLTAAAMLMHHIRKMKTTNRLTE